MSTHRIGWPTGKLNCVPSQIANESAAIVPRWNRLAKLNYALRTFWTAEGNHELVASEDGERSARLELEVVKDVTAWSVVGLGHAVHWASVVEFAVELGRVALGLLDVWNLSLGTDELALVV